jgi:hypothetical protein
MHQHLDRARDALQHARESARVDSTAREQLDSIQQGGFTEETSEESQATRVGRVAEVRNKLAGLEEEADSAETIEHIADARDQLLAFMDDAADSES